MRSGPATRTGGQGSRTIGVVSGFVLKLARQSAALTQEKLAEVLTVDVTTVQGWESVALASTGDGTHIHDFVDHMTDTRAEVANLNYWAHWIGELNDEQTNDSFMLNDDTRSWTGTRLLQHLTNRLEPDSPHLPLNLYTLHALIASRPSLLNG